MPTPDSVAEVTRELDRIGAEARSAFGQLSEDQLNWQPSPESWSVAQCLDHLITINQLYFPEFEAIASGRATQTFWERRSPLSRWFGSLLIRTLGPESTRKTRTSSRAKPAASRVDGEIVDRFARHQEELGARFREMAAQVDPASWIVTSPLLGLITYSLEDAMSILVVHEHRHLQQAQRVMAAPGFPAAT